MQGRGRQVASNTLAFTAGGILIATLGVLIVTSVTGRSERAIPRVTIGTKDEVYYSRAATKQEAIALGQLLRGMGFFRDSGSAVLLSRNPGGTVVSFVLGNGQGEGEAAIASFEEIGRRIAGASFGFPIEVRLVDPEWRVQKTTQVGKIRVGSRDEIYYFGSATESEARALGEALREAGYLKDLGVSVSISKGDGTALGFVVGEGVWQRPEAVAGFAGLARKVAPSIGGVPVALRLLSPQMEIEQQTEIR